MYGIYLPGNSQKDQEYMRTLERRTKGIFDETSILSYEHWETGESIIDTKVEGVKLGKIAPEDDFATVALSAGGWVVLHALSERLIKNPEFCVFIGSATNKYIRAELPINGWLQKFGGLEIPSMFIQKTDDPHASFDELNELLKECCVGNREIVELPGDDHEYHAFDDISGHMRDFASDKVVSQS